ncbi:MAG TPA: hypothetical protein DCX14_14650 [Flavobacteriales bacterium]|nr:hypothetical protein [Flavobacteriales bacterium]
MFEKFACHEQLLSRREEALIYADSLEKHSHPKGNSFGLIRAKIQEEIGSLFGGLVGASGALQTGGTVSGQQ